MAILRVLIRPETRKVAKDFIKKLREGKFFNRHSHLQETLEMKDLLDREILKWRNFNDWLDRKIAKKKRELEELQQQRGEIENAETEV